MAHRAAITAGRTALPAVIAAADVPLLALVVAVTPRPVITEAVVAEAHTAVEAAPTAEAAVIAAVVVVTVGAAVDMGGKLAPDSCPAK